MKTAPPIQSWEQFVYGKLVVRPGGAIVPGAEHGCTGRSAAFPQELIALCHPSRLGLGERDPRRWAQCGWRDVGGIVSAAVALPEGSWVLAGRLRERSEGGEGVEGRLYTEALYAALPGASCTADALLRVAPVLQAQPREGYDMALPPLTGSGSVDPALPSNWLEQVSLLLRSVASGEPVNVQDWEQRPEDFLRTVSWCLAALPGVLRWRLPIGAGMMTMERSTALAYGVSALGGLRVIGGVARNEGELDLSRGSRYVEWLGNVTRGCATTDEVSDALARELPQLQAFDAVDPGQGWPAVAQQVSDTVGEKVLLTQVLGAGAGAARAADLRFYRPEYIEALAQQAMGLDSARAVHALAETLRLGWHEAWRTAVGRSRGAERERLEGLAMLLGAAPATRPEMLVSLAGANLGEVEAGVVSRLAEAARDADDAARWIPLLKAATPNGGWVRRWSEAALPHLIWLGIGDAARDGDAASPLLDALPELAEVKTARDLLSGRDAPSGAISALLALARPADAEAADALVLRAASKHGAWRAYHIAELAARQGITTWLSSPPRDRRGRTSDGEQLVNSLALELARDARPVGPLMLRDLLARRGEIVSISRNQHLRESIARLIGDPYATALLGHQPLGAVGPSSDVAAQYIAREGELGDEVAERVIIELKHFVGDAEVRATDLLRHWLNTSADGVTRDRKWPVARAVRALAGAGRPDGNPMSDAHREVVKRALLTLRIAPAVMAQAATDEWLLRVAAELWPQSDGMTLRSEQLQTLLELVLEDATQREWWVQLIRKKGWTHSPGWRWIAGAARDINETERKAIERLDGQALLDFVLEGLPVPVDLASEISRVELDHALRDGPAGKGRSKLTLGERVDRLRTVLHYAERAHHDPLLGDVARSAMQLARDGGKNKKQLKEALANDGTGFGQRFTSFFRDPQTPVELLRATAKVLRRTPEDLVNDYWEETRGKGRR